MNLLIVDDEKTTRDSLKEVISWKKLGVTYVTIAKNGLEALELARQTRPEILLTDVRMPKMDGIELAGRLRKLYPDCKIVFLSGYADKDYLKSAIHLKAISYIEKPINPEEIKTVIRETVELCRVESQKNSVITGLQNSIAGSRPLIRQEIAVELVKGTGDASGLEEKYGDYLFEMPADGFFTAANICFNWNTDLGAKKISELKQVLLQSLSDDTLGNPADFIAGFDNNQNMVCIAAGKINAHTPCSKNVFYRLSKKLHDLSGDDFSFSIGIGEPAAGVSKIPESYQTAVSASRRQFFEGANQIFYYSSFIDSSPVAIDRKLFSSFKDYLEKDNLDAAKVLIENLTGNIQASRDHDINRVKNIYFHLLLIVFEIALKRGLIDPSDDQEQKYLWREIEDKKSLEELANYVLTSVQSIFSRPDEEDQVSRKIYQIMRYIRENHADKGLSVQAIGARVNLSPTYLCAFFKKATGKTLNEYITELRMEKAKELLRDLDSKLYQIATGVGFSDVNYFSTLFKKYTGCAPSEFREKYYR